MLLAILAPALQPHLARPIAANVRSRRAHLRMSSSPEAGSFELELFSPARLSLFLRVQPRADGLHDVARLSQAIDLGDRLQLARIPNTPSQAAGVVRPSRKTDPIKQHADGTHLLARNPFHVARHQPTEHVLLFSESA